MDDIVGVVHEISDHLDIEQDFHITKDDVGTEKLADEVNQCWAERIKQKYTL